MNSLFSDLQRYMRAFSAGTMWFCSNIVLHAGNKSFETRSRLRHRKIDTRRLPFLGPLWKVSKQSLTLNIKAWKSIFISDFWFDSLENSYILYLDFILLILPSGLVLQRMIYFRWFRAFDFE